MVMKYYGKELYHYGTAGMKWGYADGSRVAGKRTAQETIADAYKKKDFASVQDQVNKMAQAGKSPEEIQSMLNAVRNPSDIRAQLDNAVKQKDYASVQNYVNKLAQEGKSPEEIEKMLHESMGVKDKKSSKSKGKQSADDIAKDVIKGKYGNGEDRRKALEKAGYSYDEIQRLVNSKLKGASSAAGKSKKKEDSKSKKDSKKEDEEKKKRAVYKGGSANKNLMKSESEKSRESNRYAVRSRLKNGI